MTRDDLQNSAVRRLEKEHRLICQWATGVGKSSVVLKFIQKHPDSQCIIMVPEQNNIKNWLDEFEKFNVPSDNVRVCCYASFHRYKGTEWDLLVFDEMPHVDTEKRLAICNSVSGRYILALGALITDDERLSLESIYGVFDKSIVNFSHAIKLGILPCPQVKVLHLQLNDTEKKFYYKGRLYTAKERYDYIHRKVDEARRTVQKASNNWNIRQLQRAGNERKRFLGELKEDALRRICDILALKKKRFICFCSSITQAEVLGGDNAYTSKSTKSMAHLDKFNNHEIDSLFVVGKCIEGQNLNDIEVGVIGQIGGTDRITVQEIGRVMRASNPVIYVPIFDDTKDNGFLSTLTNNIPSEYIKHYKF